MNGKQGVPPGLHFTLPPLLQQQNLQNSQLNQEYEEQIDKIMEWTSNKPIDQRISSQTHGEPHNIQQLGPLQSLYENVKVVLKRIFGEKTSRNKLTPIQQQQQLRHTYKVKNIDIYSPTTAVNQTENDARSADNQNFYINPKYQSMMFRVEPKSNLTINDAVLYQPRSFSERSHSAAILIKNNITTIYPIKVEGNSGTGLIEIVKVYKKTGDQLINTNNYQNDIFSGLNNSTSSIRLNRERVQDFIFNDIKQDEKTDGMPLQGKQKSDSQVLSFVINLDDIIVQDTQIGDSINETVRQFESPNGLNFHSTNIRINNIHKRMFVAKNTGDLPVLIEAIYIKDRGCQGYGFTIENCQNFSLKPGEHHYIHISYETDFSIAKVRKTFVLEGKNFVQTFQIQAQLPMRFLQMAHQLGQLNQFEETTHSTMQQALLLLAAITIAFVYREVFSHYKKSFKFRENQKHKTNGKNYVNVIEIDESKIIQTLAKQHNQVLKESVASDQILAQYQQAQEKFDHPHQLLFKELSNICSKKSLVLLEAQKQAIEAEKERKHVSKTHAHHGQQLPHPNQLQFDKDDDLIRVETGRSQKDSNMSKAEKKVPNNQKSHNEVKESQKASTLIELTSEQKATEQQQKQNELGKIFQSNQVTPQHHNKRTKSSEKSTSAMSEKKDESQAQKMVPVQPIVIQEEQQAKQQIIVPKKTMPRLNKKQRKEEIARQKLRQLNQSAAQEQVEQNDGAERSENDQRLLNEKSKNVEEDTGDLILQNTSSNEMKLHEEVILLPKKSKITKQSSPSPKKNQKEKVKSSETKINVIEEEISANFSNQEIIQHISPFKAEKVEQQRINKVMSNEKNSANPKRVTPVKSDNIDEKVSIISEQSELQVSLSMSFEVVESKSNKLSNSIDNISKKSLSNNNTSQDQQQPQLDNSIHSSELNEETQGIVQPPTHISSTQSTSSQAKQEPSLTSYTKKNYREQQQHKAYSVHQQQQPVYQYKSRGSQYQQTIPQTSTSYGSGTYYTSRGRGLQAYQETPSGASYGYRNNQGNVLSSSYVKRNVGGVMGRTSYQNYEEENLQDQSSMSQSLPAVQSQPQQSIRKVINTMKVVPPVQNKARARGTHYRMSSEFEEESGEYSTYGQGSGPYQKRYRQDQYSIGGAEDYTYYNQDYGSSTGGYIKKNYNRKSNTEQSYHYDQYGQEEPDFNVEENEPMRKKQKIDEKVPTGEVSYGSFVNELERDSKKKPTGRLSKTELAPFFEKQKTEKSEEMVQKLRMQNISPSSGSLFAFQNPNNQLSSTMNVASQGGSVTTVIKESQEVVKRQIHDLLEENEDSDEAEEEQKTLGTDFYNAFKSASSLFSKPLFGDKYEEKKEKGKKGSQYYDRNLAEENPSDDEASSGTSLFSGSLFGGGGLFGPKKSATNVRGAPTTAAGNKYAV